MTTFIKKPDGLEEVGRSRIRNFTDVDAVQDAIDDGTLKPGDLFTTVAAHGISEDVTSVINCLVSITPNTASPGNMLVTQDQLTFVTDITALTARVCANEGNIATNASGIADNTSLINQVAARVGVNETNITTLQSNKVDCADITSLTDRITNAENEITTNASSIASLSDNKVSCSDFTDTVDTINTNVTSIDTALTTTASRVADLSNCAGLSCTGTLTEDDIADLTSCEGTVVAICNSNGAKHNPDENGLVTLNIPTITVSGTVLTITA